jgi:hypothetical protein
MPSPGDAACTQSCDCSHFINDVPATLSTAGIHGLANNGKAGNGLKTSPLAKAMSQGRARGVGRVLRMLRQREPDP